MSDSTYQREFGVIKSFEERRTFDIFSERRGNRESVRGSSSTKSENRKGEKHGLESDFKRPRTEFTNDNSWFPREET